MKLKKIILPEDCKELNLKKGQIIFVEQEETEEFNTEKAIQDFIEIEWSKSDEEKGKAINILKGLIYNDSEIAKKFINDLDKKSNELNVEDYK